VIFLNTQMDLFILKTDVEKFTSTYKKTLHLIFNGKALDLRSLGCGFNFHLRKLIF